MSKTFPRVRLAELTSKIGSGSTPRGGSSVYVDSGTAFIRSQNVQDFGFDPNGLAHIEPQAAETLRNVEVNKGDVLLNITGDSVARVCLAPNLEARVSQHVCIVRANSKVLDSRFLMYALLEPQAKRALLTLSAAGATRKALTKAHVEDFAIPLPPLDEQRRIAGVLGSLDDLIEVNRGLIRDLDALFHLEWSRRFAVSAAEPRVQLSDICTTQYGYTDAATSDSTGPKFLRVADINKHNWVDWKSVPHCSPQARNGGKYGLRKGDLVVARMADPGKCARVESDVDAVFASYLVRLTPSDPNLGLFLYGFLKSAQYLDYSQGAMTGSVQRNMNARVITAARLTLPQSTEVASFDAFGGVLRDSISSLLDEIAQLEMIRDELLPLLMSGRVRVGEAGVAA